MLIRGVVSYEKNTWSQKIEEQKQIVWNSSFIGYGNPSRIRSAKQIFIVGFQGKLKSEVKFWGNLTSEFTSFFDFKEGIRAIADRLCIGVWHDEQENQTHLARQIFGLCPLYYIHIPKKFFAFSTSLHDLLYLSKSQYMPSPKDTRISSFLTYLGDMRVDYNGDTFYDHVKCVLPGHLLSVSPEHATSAPFTKFKIPNAGTSLSDLAPNFRAALKEAVYSNLPESESVLGSHLSGGLDSSSVSVLVREFEPESPLHTFYYNTQGIDSDDRDFASKVALEIHSTHHEIVISEEHLEAIQSHTRILGYPQPTFISPVFQEGVFKLASQLGCQMLFNGNGGDSIVGSGFEHLVRLYQLREWSLLKDLLQKRTQFFSKAEEFPHWDNLTFEQRNSLVEHNFLFRQISGSLRVLAPRQLLSLYRDLSSHFNLSPSYFLKRGLSGLFKKLKDRSILPITLLRDDFREAIHNNRPESYGLAQSLRGELPGNFQSQFEEIFNHHTIVQNENRVILGAHYGFRNSSPFYDKTLFEFCMSVPEVVKFGNGLGRMHFREAMKGILPENVRLRSQKTHVGPYGRQSTLQLYAQARELLNETSDLWHYIDRKKFDHAIKFLKTDNMPMDEYSRGLFHVTRAISVAAWLDWLRSEKTTPSQPQFI